MSTNIIEFFCMFILYRLTVEEQALVPFKQGYIPYVDIGRSMYQCAGRGLFQYLVLCNFKIFRFMQN